MVPQLFSAGERSISRGFRRKIHACDCRRRQVSKNPICSTGRLTENFAFEAFAFVPLFVERDSSKKSLKVEVSSDP